MKCLEHDYESIFCRNCGGYCGMACHNCGTMTDGGEHTYVTMDWCHCDNQVFDFGFEEPEGYEKCSACHEIAYRNGVCESCGLGAPRVCTCGNFEPGEMVDGIFCIHCGMPPAAPVRMKG